ncbi:arylamine N-acetyltransferase [Actinoplanes sp. TRM 88003]|uniref:Arylamine N-acetyltransferase n=1 Tax=Paractinoplanes aksuensis TaxID=2939490 RepID=A0ABT1DFP3_9ACTN|nr:arylamine N-acetyltransferase [Actinoplanes aksuensis]MCO8269609.1 arylamine N-acetyltransferase [Actinoplanes aksuensis]
MDAYLRRLGVKAAPPSADALRTLHRAHTDRIPYECLDIWLGRATTVDPAESVERIVRGRGGYCYHLNGAFALLLDSLGYRVTRHAGGVQRHGTPNAGANGNHLALTVELPQGQWLVDVGLGDGPSEPVPLTEGEHRQGPFTYGLRPSDAERGGWRFDHDPRGGFAGIDFRPAAVPMEAFAARHEQLWNSPDSPFARTATVQRRDSGGADVLRGLTLTRVGETVTRTVLAEPQQYFAALGDLFGLTLGDVTGAERAALWRRLVTAHEQWSSGT